MGFKHFFQADCRMENSYQTLIDFPSNGCGLSTMIYSKVPGCDQASSRLNY